MVKMFKESMIDPHEECVRNIRKMNLKSFVNNYVFKEGCNNLGKLKVLRNGNHYFMYYNGMYVGSTSNIDALREEIFKTYYASYRNVFSDLTAFKGRVLLIYDDGVLYIDGVPFKYDNIYFDEKINVFNNEVVLTVRRKRVSIYGNYKNEIKVLCR